MYQEITNITNENGTSLSSAYAILGTIVVALIAGLVALRQIKLSLTLKSRINWIENLRDSLSLYCKEIVKCSGAINNIKGLDKNSPDYSKKVEKFYFKYEKGTIMSTKYSCKVKLYLNSKECEHKNIEDSMKKIYNHLHKKKARNFDFDFINNELDCIINNGKLILKKEWDRTKIN